MVRCFSQDGYKKIRNQMIADFISQKYYQPGFCPNEGDF
ncbi:Uncharacterised protein [Sphingobacterium multivorum]|uniref:Uncharacterized protein n=1 Tax=Sphingobacterium multivorum TaxID=28454 RepID=A0A2X2ITF9_SPHMU|nr:Uncharacterised protein [Sphingobacterium multivorum]